MADDNELDENELEDYGDNDDDGGDDGADAEVAPVPIENMVQVLTPMKFIPPVAAVDYSHLYINRPDEETPGPKKEEPKMSDLIPPAVAEQDADELARTVERKILANNATFPGLTEQEAKIAADLLVAAGELGRLPADRLARVITMVSRYSGYLGYAKIDMRPRMKWHKNELIWSRSVIQSNMAEFFGFPKGHMLPSGRFVEFNDCPLKEPFSLGKDIDFRCRTVYVFPLDPKDDETFVSLVGEIELSEDMTGSGIVGGPWRIYRPVKEKNFTASNPGLPVPARKKAAALAAGVLERAKGRPILVVNLKEVRALKNQKVRWLLRTTGTNIADCMELQMAMGGELLWDEQNDEVIA